MLAINQPVVRQNVIVSFQGMSLLSTFQKSPLQSWAGLCYEVAQIARWLLDDLLLILL